jgi:hypothetical protein
MEEFRMSNRFKRVLVLMSVGGMTLALGLPGSGCYQYGGNQTYANFLTDAGTYAVAVGVDQALANVPTALNNWFNDPITSLYSNVWTGYIQYNFAQDPTYDALLVK